MQNETDQNEPEIRIFAPIRNLFSQRYWDTIEECQEAYELGFSAVLADGKLLGYKKDPPSAGTPDGRMEIINTL